MAFVFWTLYRVYQGVEVYQGVAGTGLRRALVLDPKALEEAWRENRFESLARALELPGLLGRRR